MVLRSGAWWAASHSGLGGVPPSGRDGGKPPARRVARQAGLGPLPVKGDSFRIERIPLNDPEEKFWERLRRHKLHIPRRCPKGTGSLIPLLLLFPPQNFAAGTLFPPPDPSYDQRRGLRASPLETSRGLDEERGLRGTLGRGQDGSYGLPRRFAPRNDTLKPLSFRGGPEGRRGNPFPALRGTGVWAAESSAPTGGCGELHRPPRGSRRTAERLRRRGRGRGGNRSGGYPKREKVATNVPVALSEAESAERAAGQMQGFARQLSCSARGTRFGGLSQAPPVFW